jgi:fructokinase
VILVCGEVVLDILAEPSPPAPDHVARFAGHPGGSPANTAVALARLGTQAGMCARLATGGVGPLLREHLSSNGVDLRYCVTAAEPASLAFVDVGPDGAASYTFYVTGTADWQ